MIHRTNLCNSKICVIIQIIIITAILLLIEVCSLACPPTHRNFRINSIENEIHNYSPSVLPHSTTSSVETSQHLKETVKNINNRWTKYDGNPIFEPGPPGSWDDKAVDCFTVKPVGSIWMMWYTGWSNELKTKIGVATSVDGISWERYQENPVLNPGSFTDWDGRSVFCPEVVYEDSIFKMWYVGANYLFREAIGYAVSTDGLNWEKYQANPVMLPTQSWEVKFVDCPSVINTGERYQMWYGAGVLTTKIGYATSTDGIVWQKLDDNPVLCGGPAHWDSNSVFRPRVLYVTDLYHMWYIGNDGAVDRIGYAYSIDGIIWLKYDNNSVLDVGPPDSWDDEAVYCPSVVLTMPDCARMWYVGHGSIFLGFSPTNIDHGEETDVEWWHPH